MVVLAMLFAGYAFGNAHAQADFLKDGYEEKFFNDDEGVGVEDGVIFNDQVIRYMYDEPNVKNMAHLFWSLGLYKVTNDWAVDEYMRINECALYKKFFGDEFEWVKVRDATKDFIVKNRLEFPTRFSIIIPLKLHDYNDERGVFNIQSRYKIRSVRRFQVTATDYQRAPCSSAYPTKAGYPRILHLEFSRPFNLTGVPMPKNEAIKYVKRINAAYDKVYAGRSKTERSRYNFRNIYLVINVKIFTHGRKGFAPSFYVPTLQVMGILESYEIYEDKAQTKLIYRNSFISSNNSGELNILMKDQYEALIKMSEGDGVMLAQ